MTRLFAGPLDLPESITDAAIAAPSLTETAAHQPTRRLSRIEYDVTTLVAPTLLRCGLDIVSQVYSTACPETHPNCSSIGLVPLRHARACP